METEENAGGALVRHEASDSNAIFAAIRAGFESMKPDRADHDNIIRLMGSMDAMIAEFREMRRDNEQRRIDEAKQREALESRIRTLEGIEPVAKTAHEKATALEDRIRTIELGGAKLNGSTSVLVFLVPMVVSAAIAFVVAASRH